MNNSDNIQHVELSLSEAKKIVDLGAAVKRLEKNRDFQKVVLDGYFGDEAKRLVYLTADSVLDEKSMQSVWGDIRAIGSLRQYLINRKIMGDIAEKEVNDHSEMLEEMRLEDADQGE